MATVKGQVQGRCSVRWLDHRRQAIAALPEHVDRSTSGPICEQLLTIINHGAETLIADMSATLSVDHAGTDALARVCRRADADGTELRLVVTAPVIRRVLSISGLDRLVPIYPAVEAALAADRGAVVVPLVPRVARTGAADAALPEAAGAVIRLPVAGSPDSRATAVTPAVAWQALDVFPDAIALVDGAGEIRLANCRLEEMFGYQRADLPGRSLRILFPASFEMPPSASAADRTPGTPPLASGAAWLTGTRKDGSTFPAQIILRPVPARTGSFTLAVIRDQA